MTTTRTAEAGKYRTRLLAEHGLRPDSLIGSYFHGSDEQQTQGVIVAEPAPGIYLCELFGWITGDSTEQQLFRVQDMTGWRFYDTAEWMNNQYEHSLSRRWERLDKRDQAEATP